jgi:hypothetical protein
MPNERSGSSVHDSRSGKVCVSSYFAGSLGWSCETQQLSPTRDAAHQRRTKSRTTPYPKGSSASAPPAGRKGTGHRAVTQHADSSARADRKRCSRPEAITHAPAATASSTTEAPTKKTKAAVKEHTAARRQQGQPCRKGKEPSSQGMQCVRTESAPKQMHACTSELVPQAPANSRGPPRGQ